MIIIFKMVNCDLDDLDALDDQFHDNQLQGTFVAPSRDAVLFSQSYVVLMVFLIPSAQEHKM